MSMRAEFINPFLEATLSVLKTMASAEAVPGKPYVKTGSAACGDKRGAEARKAGTTIPSSLRVQGTLAGCHIY